MREIKFRGMYTGDPELGECWVYGNLYVKQDGTCFIQNDSGYGEFCFHV